MKIGKLFISGFSALILWLCYYLLLPTISLTHFGGVAFISLCIFAILSNLFIWIFEWKKSGLYSVITLASFIGIIISGLFIGSPLFNAPAMREQLGKVESIEFNEMIKQIDTAQIPIVDNALANKQADKKIGEDIALGSRVELGKSNIQEVNGEILYVVPLKHSGYFKWSSYKSTPGYITVSASNPNKVKYVTEIDGQKLEILYSDSAYFSYNIKRHIRNEGFRTVGLTEYTFEVNDDGYPFWVVTTFECRTLWGSPEATGVVVVDAQTGKTDWYGLNEIPDWVDIVQPQDFIENQIDNWGELIHGPFNFSKKDEIKKTDLTLTVYVDGECYYFTGMTSVGSDESCVGFIMVNTRDKHTQMCYMSGATEPAAMKSAEGLVSDFGYTSTEPLPLNVNGIPTYVMALKDSEGLIKSYAMVNIENYSIAAKGSSLQEVSRAYIQSVTRNSGTFVVGSDETYSYTYEGVVKRISSVVEDGSTYYYLVVDGEENKIFMASYTVSDELSITRDGDTVKLSYIDDKNGTVDIVAFDNIAFATPKSESQDRRDSLDEGTSSLDSENTQIVDVNPELNEETWNSLTDEEKAKLIEQITK